MNPTSIPFQYDKPVFVKIPFQGSGKTFNVGDEFKWKELGIEPYRVQVLYTQDYLHHNTELEISSNRIIGDGLEQSSLLELQAIAKREGAKISNILMKQVGLIRSNRLHPRTR
jgi:hypothetical protein